MGLDLKNFTNKLFLSILLDSVLFILLFIFYSINVYKLNKIYSLSFLLWIFFCYLFGRYHDLRNFSKKALIRNIFKSLILSFLIVKVCFFSEIFLGLNYFNIDSFRYLSYFYYIYGILILGVNFLFNFIFFKKKLNKKWFILKNNRLFKSLNNDNIESMDYLASNLIFLDNIIQINTKELRNISGIIIEKNKKFSSEEEKLILILKKNDIHVISNFEWCEKFLYRIPPNILEEEFHSNINIYPRFNIIEYRIKKINELLISILILFFSIPILFLAGIFIYKEDKGSIFYSQIRKGLYGKNIRIYKLRTMKVDSEKDGIQWSSKNDHRITKVGNFLRKTRIDEIPQLISVIKGEMSLIGPRPERPEIDNDLKKNIPCYENRYNIKPGITGWAQVNYPYGASIQDSYNKLSYDLYYLRNFSILIDLLIFFKTIRVVIKYENASFSS